ncbi:hypothetical protein NTE12_005291 [Vibrio harveyi]|nr:hypothetical protein [Vibrio harveyi]
MLADMQYSISVIDEMYSAGVNRKNSIVADIQSRCEELAARSDIPEEQFRDEVYYLYENDPSNEVLELLEEMQIVALYKLVETTMKRVLKISEIPIPEKKKMTFLGLISHKNLHLNLAEVYGYASFNELRLINNCIKHSGKVSKQLSNYDCWAFDAKVTKCGAAYDRLKQDVQRFVINWSDEVIKTIA